MNSNPAAEEGWVKSLDPASGRDFFANHITRKTQWDKPQNWVEPRVPAPPPPLPPSDDDDELPSNWEEMRDPSTGKPFYVDHERQITSWKKPKSNKGTNSDRSYSHAPAAATTTFRNITSSSATGTSNSSYHQDQHRQPATYHQEASYYNFAASHHQNTAETVDFSDTMQSLDFSVKTVSDLLRPSCPSCKLTFTLSKRRHHCRLCGDVFCDACSNHRVELPLEGSEFEKPVRVCDFCSEDVERGNFFSMRRYLTPLQLFESDKYDDNHAEYDNDTNEVATPSHVNAALDALTTDLNQMLQNPSSSTDFGDKLSKIPTSLFITSIIKHISYRATSDRAIRALASLLALENVAGSKEFTHSVYFYGGTSTLKDIMAILERTGTDRKNLFVQEQTARALFYLTDPSIMTTLEAKHSEIMHQDDAPTDKIGDENSIDLTRTLRIMLDHSSDSKNPNLQRWSTSCIRNLVLEDQRRATMAVNDFAASVASGQSPEPMGYESFLDQLILTGGIMILCTLIGADDSDTRAHATAALGATLTATRAIDASLAALSEMTGGHEGSSEQKDGQIVRAIIAGGGCASSVSQLLLSADHNVAGMGCQFVAALVTPLLSLATGNLPWHYDCGQDQDVMGACREAALEITTGSCLPALVSLVRDHGSTRTRPIELRKVAMQTLVASVHAVGEMGKAWADGKYEEGLEISNAPSKLKDAMILLNEENVTEMALQVLQSSSTGQSLGSKHDTPAARIRESAAMILASLTACSAQAIMDLQTQQVLSQLLLSSNDASMTTTPSSLRADAAPRCLGILETVSSILMFAWQHPSGASSELLDRLIEVLDAGAINYVSKVLSVDIDWESKEKAIGGMKGRSSCFKLLCCLFGIALTDETTIGMRRLMDAVDNDAVSYRQQSSRGSRDSRGRAPNNIMEATLKDLQIGSNYAKRALMGDLSLGQHYQTALMDMVEAAVLAVGSMCGSSIAPGGGEGTLIKGENFLALRNDEFVSRRKNVCTAACDVVVRGGRSGPPLVPTMLVGGFGEGTLLASLRLSLAIAQNGTKEQHLKLALSGILVPTSDILRGALAAGDLYKFSSALTLVRFCGPHIATGEGGGLQSVRDAIRVATNVLTLPIDPNATIEQIETQEALKAECVSALESLSRNAALWNSISKDAIPSMVRYLQSTSESSHGGRGSERHKETQCAVLRAVLQIVQVPSHAVSVAEGGLVGPLGKLLKNSIAYHDQDGDDKVPMLALEVLHVIAKNEQARRKARFIDVGVFQSICAAVGYAATKKAEQPSDPRADVTALGLDIIIFVLNDIENKKDYTAVLQSPAAIAFLDAVASEPHFVRAMCATFVLNTGMQIKRHDAENDWGGGDTYDVPELYGAPLVLVEDPCGGYQDTHQAVAAILMTTAVYACAIDSRKSVSFWNTCLLKDLQKENTDIDDVECTQTACTFSAIFLALLGEDFKPFIPLNPTKQQSYLTIVRPLIRHRLLEALKESIDQTIIDDVSPADPYVVSVLVQFNVPQICLSLWKDPALLDLAFGLIKRVIEIDPDDVLHLFVASKQSIQSLFDLLNLDSSSASHTTDVNEMRKFLAGVLGTLSENGLLQEAVKKFDARSSAIGALAAACLMEENSPQCPEEDEDMISNRLSSGLMKCLVDLCTSKSNISNEKGIFLSPTEADAIAKNLGKKLCHMVLSRFLERAKLQQYEMEEDEEIMEAPDVAMLCAVVQHPNAFKTIRSIGGLAALSQIASEGNLMAILAMKKACDEDASILLEDETYLSIMSLFMEENNKSLSWRLDVEKRRRIEEACFGMLGQLCRSSQRGRKAIARSDKCIQCAAKALEVVCSFTSLPKPLGPPVLEDSDDDDLEDKSVSEDDGNNSEDDDSIEKISEPEVKKPENFLGSVIPPPPAYDDRIVIPGKVAELVNMEEADLGVSCLSFLSAVVSVMSVRKEILEDDNFIKSLSIIVTKSVHAELQFEALNLLKKLAPYAESDMILSAEWLAETFQAILERKLKGSDGTKLNTNLLHSTTVEGIRTIFDCLSNDTQLKITETLVIRFMKLVKSFTAARAASGVTDRQNGGELAHSLSVLLLLGTGKDCLYSAYTQQLLSSFINVAQWRYDPKTKLNDDIDRLYWDSAVTHCLQILSLNLSRTNAQLSKKKLNLTELSKTVLMLARPGKAPRRAIDVNTALTRVAEKGDASARMSAKNILDLLF